MASIRETKTKWHIRFQKDGKEVVKSYPKSLHKKTIVRKKIHLEEQIALGRFDPFEEQSEGVLGPLLHEYLTINKESGNWSDRTYQTNSYTLQRMFDSVEADPVQKIDWQKQFDKYPGNHNTKQSCRSRVNTFLNWLHSQGYIKKSRVDLSMSDKLKIRNQDSVKYITISQVEQICKAHYFIQRQNEALFTSSAEIDYPKIWWFLFYSLLRKSELARLKVKHLHGNKLTVHGKGRRVDVIPLPPAALDIAKKFAEGKRPDEPLFIEHPNRTQRHLSKAVCMALGEDHYAGFHLFRHSGIVHYISLGKPIQFVSKLARHKSIQVTLDIYADVLPDKMEDVFSDITHKNDEDL